MAEAELTPRYGMDMKKLTRAGKEETGSRVSILEKLKIRSASSGPPSISTSYCLLGLFGLLMLTPMDPHSGTSAREQFAPVMNSAVSIDGFCYY